MAITRYSFKPVQARSQQKETLILDKELNLYRTLKNIIPCYCAVNMRVTSGKCCKGKIFFLEIQNAQHIFLFQWTIETHRYQKKF